MAHELVSASPFRQAALAFPNRIRDAIAQIDRPDLAADALAKAQAYADYAQQIKATCEEVNSIQYGKLLLAAKVGELAPAATAQERGAKGGRGKKKLAHGMCELFHRNALNCYRKLAHHQREGKIDAYWEAVVDADHEIEMSIAGFLNYVGCGGVIATRHGGGVVEWYTPKEHIEHIRKVLGTIDLDPATSEAAQKIVKASAYYTKDDDGLTKPWQGTVFLNPPFKMPLVAQFVGKLCEAVADKSVPEAILLTNDNTDTSWWQQAATAASAVCFHRGRIAFYNDAGATSAPTNGQTFCYFGHHPGRFRDVFKEVGLCLAP